MDTGTANSLTTSYNRIRAVYSTGNAAGKVVVVIHGFTN